MKKIGCVGHDCGKCKKSPTKKELRTGFEAEIRRVLGAQWVKDHPDIVAGWFSAGICGGMFRAGVRFERKRVLARTM